MLKWKLMIAGGLALLVMMGLNATIALAAPASTVNPHGYYLQNTAQCARCHNTHTAMTAKLLPQANQQLTCEVCHDGTQSYYNTKAGSYWNGTTDQPSLAGGFNTSAPDNFTSTHKIEQTSTAPGGTTAAIYLVCSSCHNPHGYPSTSNYRLLQAQINGKSVSVSAKLTALPITGSANDAGTNIFTTAAGRAAATADNREIASYLSGVSEFCTACHIDYYKYGSFNTANTSVWNYRHRVGVPLTGGSTTDVKAGDAYWSAVTYPSPGLYSTLPTEGAATGAYVYATPTLGTGSLAANTYYYAVTSVNHGGTNGADAESVPGKVYSATLTGTGQITLDWKAITNASGYKIYRSDGTTPDLTNFTTFKLLTSTPLGSNASSYVDNGGVTPGASTPPTSPNARLMCLTCHFAHGTKATVTAIGSGLAGSNVTQGSKLLRRNERGVCEDCHKKGTSW